MGSRPPKKRASPSKATGSPVVFTSLADLDAHLRAARKYDVFVYEGAACEVVLENDCRRYPLRLRATWTGDASTERLDAFASWCRDVFAVSFDSPLPGAQQTRIPGVAVKVGLYHTLDTLEVHFYKSSDRRDRRRVIQQILRLD